jgi:hypothetical protein
MLYNARACPPSLTVVVSSHIVQAVCDAHVLLNNVLLALEAPVPMQGERARNEGGTHLACEVERLREACCVLNLLPYLHAMTNARFVSLSSEVRRVRACLATHA